MRAVSQARAPSATEVIYVGGFVALALFLY